MEISTAVFTDDDFSWDDVESGDVLTVKEVGMVNPYRIRVNRVEKPLSEVEATATQYRYVYGDKLTANGNKASRGHGMRWLHVDDVTALARVVTVTTYFKQGRGQ